MKEGEVVLHAAAAMYSSSILPRAFGVLQKLCQAGGKEVHTLPQMTLYREPFFSVLAL